MKKLILGLLLFLSGVSNAAHVFSEEARVDIKTNKVTHVYGPVTAGMGFTAAIEMAETWSIPGPRLIFIDSPGGYVSIGNDLITLIEREKTEGVVEVCVVTGEAVSMAFNILSHCDVRLSASDSRFMFHHIAAVVQERVTVKSLRDLADKMEKEEIPLSEYNAKALHMSLSEYNKWADKEYFWTLQELKKIGYLDGMAFFEDK